MKSAYLPPACLSVWRLYTHLVWVSAAGTPSPGQPVASLCMPLPWHSPSPACCQQPPVRHKRIVFVIWSANQGSDGKGFRLPCKGTKGNLLHNCAYVFSVLSFPLLFSGAARKTWISRYEVSKGKPSTADIRMNLFEVSNSSTKRAFLSRGLPFSVVPCISLPLVSRMDKLWNLPFSTELFFTDVWLGCLIFLKIPEKQVLNLLRLICQRLMENEYQAAIHSIDVLYTNVLLWLACICVPQKPQWKLKWCQYYFVF